MKCSVSYSANMFRAPTTCPGNKKIIDLPFPPPFPCALLVIHFTSTYFITSQCIIIIFYLNDHYISFYKLKTEKKLLYIYPHNYTFWCSWFLCVDLHVHLIPSARSSSFNISYSSCLIVMNSLIFVYLQKSFYLAFIFGSKCLLHIKFSIDKLVFLV